jgi:hypothetical protein
MEHISTVSYYFVCLFSPSGVADLEFCVSRVQSLYQYLFLPHRMLIISIILIVNTAFLQMNS